MRLRTLAERAVGVGTFLTIFAQSTMSHEGQILFADLFICKNTRQDEIEHGRSVM